MCSLQATALLTNEVCGRAFIERVTVLQVVEKLPTFYGI
jgi:hypothetical protein